MAKHIHVYTENSVFQQLEVLKRNRTKRHRHGRFLVEGVRNINEALANQWPIEALVYATEADHALSAWARGVQQEADAAVHYEMDRSLMEQLSEKEDTSELLAVVAMPENDPNRIRCHEHMLVVVFDRPSNKGNLGTLIRSCDAFGCDGLIITGHGVDMYDPETIRASMGSFFSLPIIRMESPADVAEWVQHIKQRHVKQDGMDLQVIGTSATGKTDVYYTDLSKPTVLLIGNETSGLSKKYTELSDTLVRIPIGGSASSLNVACASSIVLYEVHRQRQLGY